MSFDLLVCETGKCVKKVHGQDIIYRTVSVAIQYKHQGRTAN